MARPNKSLPTTILYKSGEDIVVNTADVDTWKEKGWSTEKAPPKKKAASRKTYKPKIDEDEEEYPPRIAEYY